MEVGKVLRHTRCLFSCTKQTQDSLPVLLHKVDSRSIEKLREKVRAQWVDIGPRHTTKTLSKHSSSSPKSTDKQS